MFSLFGNNAAGIEEKTETFKNVIEELECSAFLLQETMLTRKGLIKIDGFQTFELPRSKSGGGGLMTGVHEELSLKKIDGSTDRQTDRRIFDTLVNIINDFACTIFLHDESLILTHIVPPI